MDPDLVKTDKTKSYFQNSIIYYRPFLSFLFNINMVTEYKYYKLVSSTLFLLPSLPHLPSTDYFDSYFISIWPV